MPSIDPNNPSAPRGALSFFLARALEGRVKATGGVARSNLFPLLDAGGDRGDGRSAGDPGAAAERGRFDLGQTGVCARRGEARRNADASEPRQACRVRNSDARLRACRLPPPKPAASTPPARAENAPVRIAIVDGPATAFDQIVRGATAIEAAADPSEAELVWDVGKNQALAQGDVLMDNVDGSMIGSIADRVRTLTKLRAIGEGRPLEVKLASEGELLTPGEIADVEVPNLNGAKLTVFNVAADATVQMIYPSSPDSRRLAATRGERLALPARGCAAVRRRYAGGGYDGARYRAADRLAAPARREARRRGGSRHDPQAARRRSHGAHRLRARRHTRQTILKKGGRNEPLYSRRPMTLALVGVALTSAGPTRATEIFDALRG